MNSILSPQIVKEIIGERVEQLYLPHADEEIVPGVLWGPADAFFSPAFWATKYWYALLQKWEPSHQWGETLKEEVVACLLGGYGITYELNRAAFNRLKQEGFLQRKDFTEDEIVSVLSEPLDVEGRRIRYRFPRQKGRFVHGSLRLLCDEEPPMENGSLLRKWLQKIPGIGIKTASWITRNSLVGYQCAVIDIHLFRAGVIMGLFSSSAKLPRDYEKLEEQFLKFAYAAGADPTKLDVLIWLEMRDFGQVGIAQYERHLP